MDRENRFSGFTNAEIYMIKRAFVEASWEVFMGDSSEFYNDKEKELFTKLMNEFTEEDGNRLYNKRKEN